MSPYGDIAEWYDSWVGTHSLHDDPYFQPIEALLGDVAGQRICDLACGQGRVARHLADLGARVVGIDLSAKLLAIARRHGQEQPRGIEYVRADASDLDTGALGVFDGVVCFMALMDIPDLNSTLCGVVEMLRPGGWFAFVILYPCFHTALSGEIETPEGVVRTIGRYFQEGHWRSDSRTGPPRKVGDYHRTLSTYVNAIIDAGLPVTRLSEPRVALAVPDSPAFSGSSRSVWAEVPAILVAQCRKPAR